MTKEEIIKKFVWEDQTRMLLHDTVYTRKHNGIEYEMVRLDLVPLMMEEYKQQSEKERGITIAPVNDRFTPPYRVGRKQKRAILDTNGIELGVFKTGNEKAAQDYCDYLNGKQQDVWVSLVKQMANMHPDGNPFYMIKKCQDALKNSLTSKN